ncbi:META domain-containing protein [Campylobacter sp. RM9334]|uniref:META domain-containing protein n=1 Tax=unclassified Campylobacter TaxID=2593542 RepID=UPI001DE80883|nr:META domain-containing protein [Campylobacter sp. RM12637]MBZ7978190.1 META domain-containing protein [Campylobacter sp. RM12654]MBZ7983593.1 META domain-containing protein [Campylobacter sp. RM12647]MBZ7992357.1 META domain-containing protein [Campylobacter sp. RM9333]MBZ8007099.1 META domain-containing protein [Campylobacter sp. RM9334]
MKKSLILLSVLAFFGCANTNNVEVAKEVKKLENKEYKISKIIVKDTNKEYSNSSNWSLIIEDNKLGMFVGCNRIFSAIKQENNNIYYENPASTKMMCPNQVMEVENAVASSLTSMQIIENGLENDKVKIIFE